MRDQPAYGIEIVMSNGEASYLHVNTYRTRAEAVVERDRLVSQPEYGIRKAEVVAVWPDELVPQGVRG